MPEIKIFAGGKERPIAEALEILSDDFLDDRGCCVQTAIDLRDAMKYFFGKCSAISRLYEYSLNPPKSVEEITEFMHLRGWYNDHIA